MSSGRDGGLPVRRAAVQAARGGLCAGFTPQPHTEVIVRAMDPIGLQRRRPPERAPLQVAVADIGSTAARFELVEVRGGGIQSILRDRVPLDLGRRVFTSGRIDDVAAAELAQLLGRWKAICDRTGAAVRFVCTSAVREAANGTELVSEMLVRTGVRLDTLSGEEEARLIARAALPHAPQRGPAAVIDVGGGSTELIVGNDGRAVSVRSLPLGSNRFGAVQDGWLGSVSEAVQRLLVRSVSPGHFRGARVALATSGTTRAVLKWAAPGSSGCIAPGLLARRLAELVAMSARARRKLFDDRAARVIPSALILLRVCELGGLELIVPCKHGLRRGVLLDLLDGLALARQAV